MPLTGLHHGNRPLGLDGHPVIGPTTREGLWGAGGTHRDGLHVSPLIATALAQALLAPGGVCHELPGELRPWDPCRTLITDLTREQAATETATHHAALAAESRMRPPLTGDWPGTLSEAYLRMMEQAYAAMPDGYVPPPDLAPWRTRTPDRPWPKPPPPTSTACAAAAPADVARCGGTACRSTRQRARAWPALSAVANYGE
ncbi:hypothetical protein ACFCV9_00830 [Streptomyces sp. NPDC056367]|uniref:hypothetical protein n=1 Tax=Streptomyces sp. NPDC056367 TaxID=3345797 RepID=UPI0035E39E23